jgi:copper(I)-binding protein
MPRTADYIPVRRPTVRMTPEGAAAARAGLAQPCRNDACDQLVPAATMSFSGTADGGITASVLGVHECVDGEVRVMEANRVPVTVDQFRAWMTGAVEA